MNNFVTNVLVGMITLLLVILLGVGLTLALKDTKNPQPNITEQPAQSKLIGTVGDYKIYEIEYEGERYVAVSRHRAVAIIKHEPEQARERYKELEE